MAEHPLEAHLHRFASAPFLFVGAGISRRYLGLENWEGLLRRFAALGGRPYEYYASSANSDLLEIATLIAADLHERWWSEDDFSESREIFKDKATTDESALKIEISRYLADSLENLPGSGVEAEELALLKEVVVDGVITTNFDPLLERIFDTFTVFVGQDELLFSDPQGVGEIYKIHGSVSAPNSLVLTTRDFERFRDRNPYLAAKLLTIFVEHPVIFLGYSLSDKNVTAILQSIASILTNERLIELQDRLIFVRWDPAAPEPGVLTGSSIVADGFTIPVQILPVREFSGVYGALGNLERRFPARVLRQLKEHVYELVRDNDPRGRLFVQDFDADAKDVDVVLGVGAIQKLVTSYKGLGRKDILTDVVNNGDDLDPSRVVDEVLSTIPTNQHVPIYKYLRGAGLLTADGTLRKNAAVDDKIRARVDKGATPWGVLSSYTKRATEAAAATPSFNALAKTCNAEEVLVYVAALPEEQIDPEELRQFLVAHRQDLFETEKVRFSNTQWAKGVCLYDWLRYRRAPTKPARRKASTSVRRRPQKP